jgi:hypothetical protein
MSAKTKQKIKRILRCWITGTELLRKSPSRPWLPKIPYFTFLTLTLSDKQVHTDIELRRKMVQPFIQQLERKFDVWHYFYVSEKQSNGNLHIHLLIDSYIPWQKVRAEWNEIQKRFGYLDSYFAKHSHHNPNSTDIHKIQAVKNLSAYVIKYCTTDKKDIPLNGRLWGCSDALRNLKPYEEIIPANDYAMLQEMASKDYIEVEIKEQYTLFTGKIFHFLEHFHKPKMDKIANHLKGQIIHLYKIHPAIRSHLEIQKAQNQILTEAAKPIYINHKFQSPQLTLKL